MIYHLDPIQLQSVGPSHTSQHKLTLQNPSNDTVVANIQFVSLHETRTNIADSIQVQIEDGEQKTVLGKNTLKQLAQTKEVIPLGTFLPNQEKKFMLFITTPASTPETNQLQQAVFSIQATFHTQETNGSPSPIATSIPTPSPISVETLFATNTPIPANSPQNQSMQIASLTQKTTTFAEQPTIEPFPATDSINTKKTEVWSTIPSFIMGISFVLFLLFFTGILFVLLRRNLKHV